MAKKFPDAVVRVNKNLTKKGKIKGKNKKETKALMGMCTHNKITRKDKVKYSYYISHGKCYCTMCGEEFPAKFFKDDEIDESVNLITRLNNHNKYIAVATNAGNETISYFANMGAQLKFYKKLSKKVRNIALKKNDIKKSKKRGRYRADSSCGDWAMK